MGNSVENPPDIGAYQNSKYISGFLSSTTLSGNVAATDDIVVPSGNTLTILPGTNIRLKNYSSITVYGTLDCDYNSQQGDITFDLYPNFESFEGDTIWFLVFYGASSSSSNLQHATLNHNYRTLCLVGADVNITNCNFLNTTEGIYLYNSAPSIMNNTINNPHYYGLSGEASGLSPWIQGNTIEKTTNLNNYAGIFLSNSTVPTFYNNNITGFYWGAYFTGGCVASTRLSLKIMYECNNNIVDNVIGIQTANSSTTDAGQDDGTGSFNSIYNNSLYDIYTTQYSYLTAFHDWFGSNYHVEKDATSYNDWSEYRGDYDYCNQSRENVKNIILASNKLNKSSRVNIYDGSKLENEGRIDDAISFYKELINNDDHVVFALTNLAKIKNKYNRPEILNYFENILSSQNKYYGKIKNLIGDIYLQANRFEDAITVYNDVISHSSNSYDGINARFEKLLGYLHIKNNIQMASQILADIKSMNLEDQESLARIKMAEELIEGASSRVINKKLNSDVGNIPESYELSQNYPNPFNPTTKINYQIPKAGFVTLKVYDIIGREVACLVSETKTEGYYTVNFNALKLASGVYIYQLRSGNFVSSKKMVLTK